MSQPISQQINIKIDNDQIRAELSKTSGEEYFLFVRNLKEKGGVIDGLVSGRKAIKASEILRAAGNKSFSNVWDDLISVGVKLTYQAN